MKKAAEINFIGYGFPDSDIDNINLFLGFKDRIKDIVIFDEESEKRLKRLFNKSHIMNMDAYSYLEKEFYRR